MSPFVELSSEELLEEYDRLPSRATPEWVRIHDEIARRVRAKGMLVIGDIVLTATEDGSFSRSTRKADVIADSLRLGRATELVHTLIPDRRHGRRSE